MVEQRMMSCSYCNREIPADTAWCRYCGEQTQGRCRRCDSTNPRDSSFCQSCGSPLNSEASSTISSSTHQNGVDENQGSNNTTASDAEYGDNITHSIAMGNWSIVPLIGSILGALVLIFGVLGAEGAPQEAAAAAIGIGLAAIPHVFARAISELQARNK